MCLFKNLIVGSAGCHVHRHQILSLPPLPPSVSLPLCLSLCLSLSLSPFQNRIKLLHTHKIYLGYPYKCIMNNKKLSI